MTDSMSTRPVLGDLMSSYLSYADADELEASAQTDAPPTSPVCAGVAISVGTVASFKASYDLFDNLYQKVHPPK